MNALLSFVRTPPPSHICSMGAHLPGRIASGTLVSLLCSIAICLAAGSPPAPAQVEVIALAGTGIPDSIDLPESAAATIENLVSESLRKLGFKVIPSKEFDTVWRDRLVEAGGYFDIISGLPDLERRRALLASALRELNERHGVRVLLRPELVIVTAEYSRGKASWDGAKETAAPSGSGEVPALSLAISAEDVTGRVIGRARAGIQLLAKHSTWNGKYGAVPKEKLLADDEQLCEAVARALTPVHDTITSAPGMGLEVDSVGTEATIEEVAIEIEQPPKGTRVVALRALVLPDDAIVVPSDVQERYFDLLRAQFEEKGWWVLPPEAYELTLRQVALELGGIYDPLTGEESADKRMAVHSEVRRRLMELYDAGAFVTAGIFVRPARIAGEKATWDGVSEKVTDIATWKKLLTTTRGTTSALSFGVMIEDVHGTPEHIGWGGIQLVDRLEQNRFVRVSPERLFANPELDRRAVDLSLHRWLSEPGASSAEDRQ